MLGSHEITPSHIIHSCSQTSSHSWTSSALLAPLSSSQTLLILYHRVVADDLSSSSPFSPPFPTLFAGIRIPRSFPVLRTYEFPRASPKNTHILDGEAEDLYKECEDYEAAIKAVGGIDLFLGGIGAGALS